MEQTMAFEAERPRLVGLATRMLDDGHEAEDIVQQAWLRFAGTGAEVLDPAAWLTTVTSRLCIDRLRARVPMPVEFVASSTGREPTAPDPGQSLDHAERIGQALHLVASALTPDERVAFVLADTFGYPSSAVGEILERSPQAARQLASRARRKLAGPGSRAAGGAWVGPSGGPSSGAVSDWQVVDAFLAAARGGDLKRLLELLAPDARIAADAAAVLAGTPASIVGRQAVAEFFDGSAKAARSAFVEGRPGAAWFHLGQARVAFDFSIVDGGVTEIVFRAEPDALASVVVRKGAVTLEASRSSEG